jgi:hypothetical protein
VGCNASIITTTTIIIIIIVKEIHNYAKQWILLSLTGMAKRKCKIETAPAKHEIVFVTGGTLGYFHILRTLLLLFNHLNTELYNLQSDIFVVLMINCTDLKNSDCRVFPVTGPQ